MHRPQRNDLLRRIWPILKFEPILRFRVKIRLLMHLSKLKNLILKCTAFVAMAVTPLLSFALGVVGTLLWYEISPPTVSLCQLTKNPYFYAFRTIRVEAEAYSYGAVFIRDETCNMAETAAAGVWRAEGYEVSPEIQTLFAESKGETYSARILVTGRFNPYATLGCYVPKAAIHATSIELKSEITAQPLRKTDD